jgi:hypothetical protein
VAEYDLTGARSPDALMMSSKVPFNGASNDAGSGRARDEV